MNIAENGDSSPTDQVSEWTEVRKLGHQVRSGVYYDNSLKFNE